MIGGARVFRYFKVKLYPGAREILKVTKTDAPLVAEKSLGRGKVILFTAGAVLVASMPPGKVLSQSPGS